MSSRKSQKKARRQKRKQHALRRPDRKPGPDPLGLPTLVLAPGANEKMSDVLKEFAWPFLEEADFDTDAGYRNFFGLAAAAWNIALLPDDQQQREIDEVVDRWTGDIPADARSGMRILMDRLIDRKKADFPHDRRFITSFELIKTGEKKFQLNVIWTLPLSGAPAGGFPPPRGR